MWYWDHGFGTHWFGAVVMIVTAVLFWGGLAAVVVVLLRRFSHEGNTTTSDAERILDERFARGEIDEEELKQRRAALHGKS